MRGKARRTSMLRQVARAKGAGATNRTRQLTDVWPEKLATTLTGLALAGGERRSLYEYTPTSGKTVGKETFMKSKHVGIYRAISR
jgi:hypothetical protein